MNNNSTPGPWEVFVSPQERDNGCPNADLIAAAPELYEGLMEAAVNFCNCCKNLEKHSKTGFECTAGENECPINKWRNALRKARGLKT